MDGGTALNIEGLADGRLAACRYGTRDDGYGGESRIGGNG